jgi:type II secretory pathway component PulK
MKPRRKSERGVALLATLMAIALMTITVMDFTSNTMLGYRAAANRANELRAEYLARSGVNVGLSLLSEHARKQINADQNQQFESLTQVWAQPFGPVQVGGGTASVRVVDEERKLNINLLVVNGQQNAAFEPILEKLFTLIGVSLDVIPAIIDWLDPDSIQDGPTGAEADYYMRLFPPYAPRNGPMPTIGDLRMVRGIDDAAFRKLKEYLTVIDDSQGQVQNPQNPQTESLPQVNFNTAPPEVLAAIVGDASLVKEILAMRAEQALDQTELETLMSSMPQAPTPLFQSRYFTIEGRGTFAGSRKIVFAMVFYDPRQPDTPAQLRTWQED